MVYDLNEVFLFNISVVKKLNLGGCRVNIFGCLYMLIEILLKFFIIMLVIIILYRFIYLEKWCEVVLFLKFFELLNMLESSSLY